MDKTGSEVQGLNQHYAKAKNVQPIDVADAWELDRYEFSALKYLYRRGNKEGNTKESDILKAIWYLVYCISRDKKLSAMVVELVRMRKVYMEIKNDESKQETNRAKSDPEFPYEHWSN